MSCQNGDIISFLPDAVLCHILSFLPTKYSARTRLVSTRWKYLFASVPVLDFDYRTPGNVNNDGSRKRFIEFVSKVLMMYNLPQITRFRLVSNYSSSEQLDNFVSLIWSAICRNVEELNISVVLSYGYASSQTYRIKKMLPLDLFSSEKLSILKLDGPFEIKLLGRAFLPCLKTLHLAHISFTSNVLSICPALEDFSVDASGFGEVLDISHPILRKLRIENCYEDKLVLNAPSLVCFEYLRSGIIDVRGVSVMTSLVKVKISPEPRVYNDNFVAKLVSLVSHVRRLYLSLSAIEELDGSFKALPTFHNLTCLEVGEVSYFVFVLLPDVLNKCSFLEVLVFTEGVYNEELDFDDCNIDMEELYENVPSCVSVHLKEIEFRAFTMQKTERRLVKYFLKNAKVLKKMKIQSLSSCEEQLEYTKKLLAFPRYSRECQIVIG